MSHVDQPGAFLQTQLFKVSCRKLDTNDTNTMEYT